MKCLYWNIRGVANISSRLGLKRLIKSNKLDIVLIDKPLMNFSNFPKTNLSQLELKLFAMNNRLGLPTYGACAKRIWIQNWFFMMINMLHYLS